MKIIPKKVHLHKQSNKLELIFNEEPQYLTAEFLRIHSPSAEVQGHAPGEEKLIHGKINLGIESLRPTGNYGVQIVFEDGHDSGIFSWAYLKELCDKQEALWDIYLNKLQKAKKTREPHTSVIQFSP